MQDVTRQSGGVLSYPAAHHRCMNGQPLQPDALAKGASHVIVGVAAAIIVGCVLVNFAGPRKASPLFQFLAAGAAIWFHNEMDLPLAKKLAETGF